MLHWSRLRNLGLTAGREVQHFMLAVSTQSTACIVQTMQAQYWLLEWYKCRYNGLTSFGFIVCVVYPSGARAEGVGYGEARLVPFVQGCRQLCPSGDSVS